MKENIIWGVAAMDYEFAKDSDGKPYLKVSLTDYALMLHSLLNKGMAFSNEERDNFNLWGLLPPIQVSQKVQIQRSYESLKSKSSDLEKYIYLRDLQDSNETLFYSLLLAYIEEIMPIVYTPVVGLGCQRFSHIYRRPRGIFISYPHHSHIDAILANRRFDNVKVIVVSDGERILGLGDQGAGGMGIPIGKLSLYTACAGIHPAYTLPVLLDSGTNNPALQKDPLYIGWQHERVRGQEYDEFVDAFVQAVKKRFPHILLQWEDFAQQNANPLLERYRDQLCTFNDDIQGTAAVAAGTLFAAIKVTKSKLADQRIVVVGGGSAGCGISSLIKKAMMDEGLSEEEARKRFFIIDRVGLLMEDSPGLLPFQKPFLRSRDTVANWKLKNSNEVSFEDVVKNAHPTVLIGVSGQGGIFSEEIVREMTKHVERPIIFPLSNPTSRSEAVPSDLMKWTDDKAIIGTGSPFPEIQKNGKPFRIDQTNNSYIFPGVGLGIIAIQGHRVTERMFMAAARALANCSPALKNSDANLLPPIKDIRKVALKVAVDVAKEAFAAGLTDMKQPADLEKHIADIMWEPVYVPYKRI